MPTQLSDSEFPSVYEEQEYDATVPGYRTRSRPGEGPGEQKYAKVKDAFGIPVSGKPSNKGMLASQRRRLEHERLLAERAAAKKSNPSTSGPSVTIRTMFLLAIFLPLLSSFITGNESYSFHLSPYVVPPARRWWRQTPLNPFRKPLKTLTPLQLSRYDGTNSKIPLYLAIDGDVYDVSANRRMYGPGGSYNVMAGRDASRSFVSGCFQTHLTHDLRGFNADDLQALENWKSFFANHEKYFLVGRVLNPTIDPASPIPEPCEGDASSLGQLTGVPQAAGGPPVRRS